MDLDVVRLKALWLEGGKTMKEVADELGVTRNTVAGKISRLRKAGELPPATPNTKRRSRLAGVSYATPRKPPVQKLNLTDSEQKPEVSVAPPQPLPEVEDALAIDNPTGALAAVLKLNSHTCRWPIGDPRHENFTFCCEPVKVGFVYCSKHCLRGFTPLKPRLDTLRPHYRMRA